jgi:hypothetical protein
LQSQENTPAPPHSSTATRQKTQQVELNATNSRLGIAVKSCDRGRSLNHS